MNVALPPIRRDLMTIRIGAVLVSVTQPLAEIL
jgi:hypothetical protein